jgi:hypothetical protein
MGSSPFSSSSKGADGRSPLRRERRGDEIKTTGQEKGSTKLMMEYR